MSFRAKEAFMSFIKRVFNPDAPFWRFMGKLADTLLLHILWLVCSLPIITFGASTIALYYAMMKNLNDEDNGCCKAFFRSFKLNFKQGIAMGLIFLLGSGLMLFLIQAYYAAENPGTLQKILGWVQILLFVLFFFTFEYAFPLMARFDNTVMQTLKNGLLMSLRHLGWTLAMTAVFVAVYLVAFYFGIWPILFFGFGLVVMMDSYVLNRVLKPYLEKALADADSNESGDTEALTDGGDEV